MCIRDRTIRQEPGVFTKTSIPGSFPIGNRAEFTPEHNDAYGGWEVGHNLRLRPYEAYAIDAGGDGGSSLGNTDHSFNIRDIFHQFANEAPIIASSNYMEFYDIAGSPVFLPPAFGGHTLPSLTGDIGNGVTLSLIHISEPTRPY